MFITFLALPKSRIKSDVFFKWKFYVDGLKSVEVEIRQRPWLSWLHTLRLVHNSIPLWLRISIKFSIKIIFSFRKIIFILCDSWNIVWIHLWNSKMRKGTVNDFLHYVSNRPFRSSNFLSKFNFYKCLFFGY